MRVGINPAKEAGRLEGYGLHRVIVPVYIPNSDGYFRQSLEILKLSLESLYLTASGKAAITVISNGCSPEVVEELNRMSLSGWFDQLILNRKNRGKVDAILSVARGSFEGLTTISDCDVLFKPEWLEAVTEIFRVFPESGLVAPVPSPGSHWYHASATLLGGLFRRELRLEKVVSDEEMDQFARSISRPDLYQNEYRAAQVILKRGNINACVGCGHFVFTMRKETLKDAPHYPSLDAVGNSEMLWFDLPNDKRGYWRLATARAYAYHMGNSLEPWMFRELEEIRKNRSAFSQSPLESVPAAHRGVLSRVPWSIRENLVNAARRTGIHKLIFSAMRNKQQRD